MEKVRRGEVVKLARKTVEAIDKLANWGNYSRHYGPRRTKYEEKKLKKTLDTKDYKLYQVAKKRAEATGRDLETVLNKTTREFFEAEAVFFKRRDPWLTAMKRAVVEEEECSGISCGICLEEFEVGDEASAPACMHKFHGLCMLKWLKDHKTCPVCRLRVLN